MKLPFVLLFFIFPVIHFQIVESSQKFQFQSEIEKSELSLEEDSDIKWIKTDLNFNKKALSAKLMRKSVCFDEDLGCFNVSGVPETPEQIGTVMKLYTRQNQHQGQNIVYDEKSTITKSNFNPGWKTVFFHSWNESKCR